MKYILYLIVLLISLSSCSQHKELSFENNGGMILTLHFDETNVKFKEKIIERIIFFNKINKSSKGKKYSSSSLITTSKNDNELIIKFPYLLKKDDLNKLILSKGKMIISRNDEFLEETKIKGFAQSYSQMSRPSIDVIFNDKTVLSNYLNNSINKKIVMTIDQDTVSSLKVVKKITYEIDKIPFSMYNHLYNENVIYTLIKNSFDDNVKLNIDKKIIYLKSTNGIVEMKPEIFSLYKEVRSLMTQNYGLLYNVFNEISPANNELSKILLKKDVEEIIKYDLENFLIEYNFESIDYFKKFFNQFNCINNYKNRFDNKAQEELLKIMNVIDQIDNYN